ncbi:hypothetical protein BOTBODRAFT_33572 [Botryobasidium botryosum FD-172 SS1]|uniref:C2H2-type domain-containing protein n=1 Tax=Botryobasidium botryosum (strain FD-172 SS1) TaxID=930990 RepID=A0A067MDC2_BOTB1|nr:hypothetical protein BOTBODRAFT_33572 [Botryobasidium botryosum FD-172 SS1]
MASSSQSAPEVSAAAGSLSSNTVDLLNSLVNTYAPADEQHEEGDWDEGDEEGYDGEEGDDDYLDAEAQAEEMARQLGHELMAQIGLAFGTGAPSQEVPAAPPPPPTAEEPPLSLSDNPLVATIQTILQHAGSSPEIKVALDETIVPGSDNASLFTVLTNIAASGDVDPDLAESLSELISAIANAIGDDAPVTEPAPKKSKKKGKRKRAEGDEARREGKPAPPPLPPAALSSPSAIQQPSQPSQSIPPSQPPHLPPRLDLNSQLANAIAIITRAFEQSSSQGTSLDASVIASIQSQLYQVFLFAATSAGVGGGHEMVVLQEISGLIQVLGVVSGVQIAPTSVLPHIQHQYQYAYSHPHSHPMYHPSMLPHPQHPHGAPAPDFGTAVFPCNYPGCGKTFARLFSLRTHQQIHSADRPYRCTFCPTAFARNHDLQRHIRSHGSRMYRCGGCEGMFSRRDALKRHKSNTKNTHPGCASSPVEVIDAVDPNDVKGRRARPALGAPGSSAADMTPYAMELEEGELAPQAVARAQTAVAHLHSLLQIRVAQALGGTHEQIQGHPSAGGWGALAALVGRTTGQIAQSVHMPYLQPLQPQPYRQPQSQPQPHTVAASQAAQSTSRTPEIPSATASAPAKSTAETTLASTAALSGSLANYGLNEEQTRLLELAIAIAADAAQAQAEKEARMEEEMELEMGMGADGEAGPEDEGEEYGDEDGEWEWEHDVVAGYGGGETNNGNAESGGPAAAGAATIGADINIVTTEQAHMDYQEGIGVVEDKPAGDAAVSDGPQGQQSGSQEA